MSPHGIPDLQRVPESIPLLQPPPPISPPRRPPEGEYPPVEDNGEPLIELEGLEKLTILNLYHRRGWPGTEESAWARTSVVERLCAARQQLPEGFGLAVFDAWRSPTTVRSLFEAFYGSGSGLSTGFLADPDDPDRIPPHTTGGAVDVTLTHRGQALALGTWFDGFSPEAHTLALEGEANHPCRDLRRLLHGVMRGAGFAALPEEWWHFSFGDQAWAYQIGAPAAIYGEAAPDRHGAAGF